MDEWIQLTDEDIERATRLQRPERNPPATPPPSSPPETAEPALPSHPATLTITLDDLEPEAPETPTEITQALMTITLDDLRPVRGPVTASPSIARLEQLMFDLVNETRQNHLARLLGTASLGWHALLATIARQHSADMLRRQYVDHVTPEGLTTAQRIQRKNISYVACGENIGVVYGEAAYSEQAIYDIHNAFMNQPRSLTNHRANLLNPLWTHMGVGISLNPDGALVATQLFISAPGRKLRGE